MAKKININNYILKEKLNIIDENSPIFKSLMHEYLIIKAVFLIGFLVYYFFLNEAFDATISSIRDFHVMPFILIMLAGLFVVTFCHELIHGILMRLFSHKKVKYGFTEGMFYASCPDFYFTRNQFILIAIMPTIIINSILVALLFLTPSYISFGICFILFIHYPGCVGDMIFFRILRKQNKNSLVVDTNVGIDIYEKIR